MLDELITTYGLRGPVEDFDQERAARDLLLPDAPKLADWAPDQPWRWDATIVAKPEIYVHDWGDAEAIDRWLYRRYPAWEQAMITKLRIWLAVARDWAERHGVPLVFGEGWVGYTPRDGRFEEGPVGAEFCRLAVDESTRVESVGHHRLLQRRPPARHVVRRRPAAAMQRRLPAQHPSATRPRPGDPTMNGIQLG